nr:MAG TPA: hypothetical protein [Bacteriophage sp.]DAI79567.1 MAG TPA: hypothetical protein [Caudoviricetes sp.]
MYPLRFHPSYGYAAYCGTSFFLAPPGNVTGGARGR